MSNIIDDQMDDKNPDNNPEHIYPERSFIFESRLETAQSLKEKGNDAFQNKNDFDLAIILIS